MLELSAPVIAIVGPTASGKTDAAQIVAERLGGEVVSADSMQIYRGMDIGTGKLPASERRVPHHGFDLVDLILDLIVLLLFKKPDVDDHIEFVCAVFDSLIRLFYLRFERIVSFRKRNNGANLHPVADILFRLLNEFRRDTYRSGLIPDCVVTDLFHLFPRRVGRKDSVIDL